MESKNEIKALKTRNKKLVYLSVILGREESIMTLADLFRRFGGGLALVKCSLVSVFN